MRRLYKELENYGKSDFYPFHMPGHKRNKACIEGDFPIERDITEIDGFDDLHHSEGILLEAQNALSRMYGTRKSFFSVNGSTAGILTAISASVKKGGQILVARNCHKAVYHAIYLRELVPTYIYPQSDNDLGIMVQFPYPVWKDILRKIRKLKQSLLHRLLMMVWFQMCARLRKLPTNMEFR